MTKLQSLRTLPLVQSRNGHQIFVHYSPHYLWDGSQNPVVLIGGVHGDEPEGVDLAEQFLIWLDQRVTQDALSTRSGDPRPWIVITCLNPDGYFATPRERVNGGGVDLNRNFPSQDWTPTTLSPRYNPGLHPASEPEVKALVNLLLSEKPCTIIHCHSIIPPCIVYTGEPGKNVADVLGAGPKYTSRPDIGYPTPGSLGQYGWNVLGVPVICIEEQEKVSRIEVWNHFKDAFEKLYDEPDLFPSRQTETLK